ncbi:hypothetical protein CRG98_043496 [Punica granatum]|uniref:UspA domain-containing protein n=1 Tax=Punica granatum TaxID=22663 RepID=A0A2I0HWM8_PUNGR|nr:hypothetical protein CRG98_043496 [Punica granatum]
MVRKKVMVVADRTSRSKHAMIWVLTHITNKGDLLILLHVMPPGSGTTSGTDSDSSSSSSPYLANSLIKSIESADSMEFYSKIGRFNGFDG